MNPIRFFHDEPALTDSLDRERVAKALTQVVTTCDTPLVIGLYGTWGTGKTSLMKIIDKEIERSGEAVTVWFDPWQHQYDEDPAVALLHTMVEHLGLGEEGRRLVSLIASALGSFVLKATTTLSTADLRDFDERYQEQRFLIREKQIRLRHHFSELVSKATGDGNIRIAFFIDDLDRCLPDNVLQVLEALKLYFNLPGCVYILGVDRSALEHSIRHRYQTLEISETDYLDKIVQLPFTIPPLSLGVVRDFVGSLLPEELRGHAELVASTLGDNPRQVKRFTNGLALNHVLATELMGEDYEPTILVAALVLQYRYPQIYREILLDSSKVSDLISEGGGPFSDSLVGDKQLQSIASALRDFDIPVTESHIRLSEVAGVSSGDQFEAVLVAVGEHKIPVIKEVRSLTGLGLKESKDLVESVKEDGDPALLSDRLTHEQAERVRVAFEQAGAQVIIA
jgi:ribosomal protein L7/L12